MTVVLLFIQAIWTLAISRTAFSTNASVLAEAVTAAPALCPLLIVCVFTVAWMYKGWNTDGYVPVLIGSGLSNLWLLLLFGSS